MKTSIITKVGLSAIMAAILAGCGGQQEEGYSVKSAPQTNTQQESVTEQADASAASPVAGIAVEQIEYQTNSQAVQEDMPNVFFSLQSAHFQTIPASTKSVTAAGAASYEVFNGTLAAHETNTGQTEEFDWIAKIDETGMVAISNKTLVLSPGSYELELLLENAGKQYVGTSSVIVEDKDQLEVNFELNALIGDVITDIAAINGLSTFELNFPNDELAEFDSPRVGVIVNGGDENIYNINKTSGKPEGVINIVKGDEVQMKFYDGGLQKGKSETVVAEGGKSMQLTFSPIYGEVDVQGIGDANGTIDMGFKVPQEIVEEAGSLDNVFTLLTYQNGATYKEVPLSLTAGSGAYDANYTITNASYDTLGYSVIFSKEDSGEEIGRCTQEAFDLSKDEATKSCQIDLKRAIVMDASFEGVAGFNVYDEFGDSLAGMSIYANDEFIGFTGSGAFGSKGYIKSYFKPDTYVIKAESANRSYAKEVTIRPLSVNNYEFLVPTGLPEGDAVVGKSDFALPSGQSEATNLTLTNIGLGILFYEVTVESAQGTSMKVVKRALPKTGDTIIIGKSANDRTGVITFDYIRNDGTVESKSIDYDDTDNRVIVKYKEGSKKLTSASGKAHQFEVKKIDAKTAGEYMTGVNEMLSDPEIEYVEPDQKVHLHAAEPLFDLQWGHHNEGAVYGFADVDIDWKEYRDAGNQISTVVVGVIDTGVNYSHEDITANMWRNPGETPNNGIDDDGNGYVDDVYGYDFYANDNNPMDEHGHGTHVSGIIAAAENGKGIVGVNPTAKIMALRFLGPDGSGYTSGAVLAIQYAIDNGAQLTNNSWGGGGYSTALRDMIAKAMSANQLFVAAAGNDNTNIDSSPSYPASYDLDNMIVVGSSDYFDEKSSFSNYGVNTVDILAPGSQIASLHLGNNYVYMSGTSMASPYVAGAASLLLGKNSETPYEFIKQALLENGDQTPAGLNYTSSGNRLNAFSAFNAFDPNQEWLILSGPLTGELQEDESKSIDVTVDASYLNAGTSKEANITVNFNSNTKVIPLSLSVQ